MGTSMGGAIAINFVHLHPQHVRKLVLVAPAGLPVHVPATAQLAQLPLIGACVGAWVRGYGGRAWTRRDCAVWSQHTKK